MGDSCSFYYPEHEDGTSARRVREENRRLVIERFRKVLGPAFPAQWVDDRTSNGDFEGREVGVDVFNVPVRISHQLLLRLEDARNTAKGLVGSRCIFIFHTPDATAEHYKDLVAELTKS